MRFRSSFKHLSRRLFERVNITVTVEKINQNNKQRFLDFLRSDVIRHVFAFYDIQYMPKQTNVYTAFENGVPKGYILIYTALEFPSVVMECESNVAKALVEYAPESKFIMHTPSDLLPIVKGKFPDAKHYVENWMLVKKGQASFSTQDMYED